VPGLAVHNREPLVPPDFQPAEAKVSQVSGMLPGRLGALHVLLDYSLEMLQQAKSEEWPDVIQTGAQRERLITDFFATAVAPAEADEVALVLKKMLRLNQEIEMLAVNSRGGVSESIGSIQQGRRAILAYAENAGEAAGAGGRE